MADRHQKSDWQKLLTIPDPVSKTSLSKQKQSGRVLTGSEFLEQVKEKKQKRKEEALKEERKHAREKKAKERALKFPHTRRKFPTRVGMFIAYILIFCCVCCPVWKLIQ
jgi:hypothetical protein